MMKELGLGQVVRSKAGRDKDIFMIVVGLDDAESNFVLVSDGDLRKIDRPKKKKMKHLAKTNCTILELRDKLMNGDKILNAEIRQGLASFNHSEVSEEQD